MYSTTVNGFAARSKEISGPYPIVLSPTSLATPSPTFTPKSGRSDQQVQFTYNFYIVVMIWDRVSSYLMQETTDMEENIDSPACMPAWLTDDITESKGDEVKVDKGVNELEPRELQDLTDSGMSFIIIICLAMKNSMQ